MHDNGAAAPLVPGQTAPRPFEIRLSAGRPAKPSGLCFRPRSLTFWQAYPTSIGTIAGVWTTPARGLEEESSMLTRKSLELLIDLVEIKLGSMEIFDRDDQRIVRDLEACRKELSAIARPRQTAPVASAAEAILAAA
jgi:hypothetical protein